MKPIKEYLKEPNPEIGGALVPILGPPGSVKSIGLTQIGIRNIREFDHRVVWRGTEQAQWVNFLANDIPVTVWNHDSITDLEAYISGDKQESKVNVDLENKDVRVREWSDAEELVSNLSWGRVNVVNVPGLRADSYDLKERKYFFINTWLQVIQSLVERTNLSFVTLLMDEAGDIFPAQSELKKPYYHLVANKLPHNLSQLRKQNCFMYLSAHSYHDLYHSLYKVKANSIIYTAGALVNQKITPQVDQSFVSNMERGKFVMPPKSDDRFKRPKEGKTDLEWVPDSDTRKFRVNWTVDLDDYIETEEDEEEERRSERQIEIEVKKMLADNLYNDSDLNLSQQNIAGLLDMSSGTVNKAVS